MLRPVEPPPTESGTNPSRADWERCARSAVALVSFHIARQWGLIGLGPPVDAYRCAELLGEARRQGVLPSPSDADGTWDEVWDAFDRAGLAPCDRCDGCDGCGQIADSKDGDGEPWSAWEALPERSKGAIYLGLVRPVACPRCDGSGVTTVTGVTVEAS